MGGIGGRPPRCTVESQKTKSLPKCCSPTFPIVMKVDPQDRRLAESLLHHLMPLVVNVGRARGSPGLVPKTPVQGGIFHSHWEAPWSHLKYANRRFQCLVEQVPWLTWRWVLSHYNLELLIKPQEEKAAPCNQSCWKWMLRMNVTSLANECKKYTKSRVSLQSYTPLFGSKLQGTQWGLLPS